MGNTSNNYQDNGNELRLTLSVLNTRIAELSNTSLQEEQRQLLDSIRQLFNKSCVIIDQQHTRQSVQKDEDLNYELFDFPKMINDIIGSLVERAGQKQIGFFWLDNSINDIGSVVFAKRVVAEVLSLLLIFSINKKSNFEIRIRAQNQSLHFYKSMLMISIEMDKALFNQKIISFGELFFSSQMAKYELELLASCKDKIEQIKGTLGFECSGRHSRFSLCFPYYPYYPLTNFENKEIYQDEVIFVTANAELWENYNTLYEPLNITSHYAFGLDGLTGLFEEMLINEKKLKLLIIDLVGTDNKITEKQAIALNKIAKVTSHLILLSETNNIPSVFNNFADKRIYQQLPPVDELLEILDKSSQSNKEEIDDKTTLPFSSILLVDDSKLNREIMKMALRDFGIEIDEANNGYEALENITQNSYDLLIVDMRMPKMDGITLIKKIRTEIKDLKTPILGITGDDESEVEKDFLLSGGTELLIKPIDNRLLIKTISKYTHDAVKFYDELQIKLRTNNNSELQGRLKKLLLKEVISSIEALRNTDSRDTLRDISHKLVTSAAYCGYMQTSRKATALEKSVLKDKDFNYIKDQKYNLIQSLEKTKLHLENSL